MKRLVPAIGVGISAAAFVLGLAALSARLAGTTGQNPFEIVELKTYDWRMAYTARPETARSDIVLVAIDEASLRSLQPNAGRWPWPRVVHSFVIDYLARAGAKLIVYDVNFAEPDTRAGFTMGDATVSGAESDGQLIESVRKAGNVVLVADASFEGETANPPEVPTAFRLDAPGILERSVIFPPFQALATAAAALGHSLFLFDRDGPIRHTVPLVRARGGVLPSLGIVAAMRAAGIAAGAVRLEGQTLHVGTRTMQLAWNTVQTTKGPERHVWGLINFRGPAFPRDRTYKSYSFFDLLYANEQIQAGVKPDLDPALFRDKIVFVGVTASGLADTFETPFSLGAMPGAQVHAAVADDVLSGRFLDQVEDWIRIVGVVVCAIAVGLVSTLLPAWWATAASLVFVGAVAGYATHFFAHGNWYNLSQPVLASSVALFGGVGYQYFVEGREKRKMKRLFGQYVSKDVYEQLVADPTRARLGGARREMTVLFSDIRGFTSVSERGEPEAIVDTLNEYFTRMVEIVFAHHGTLDKFVGDMVMALFGAPLDDPQHADHAVAAALEMIDALAALNRKWAAEGRPALDIGIGISTGPMIAGNIGSEAIMSYTVIGDAVNLGARLESLNKEYGTRIIISDATKDRLTGRYTLRSLGDVVVKGKTRPVAIFEVTPLTNEASV